MPISAAHSQAISRATAPKVAYSQGVGANHTAPSSNGSRIRAVRTRWSSIELLISGCSCQLSQTAAPGERLPGQPRPRRHDSAKALTGKRNPTTGRPAPSGRFRHPPETPLAAGVPLQRPVELRIVEVRPEHVGEVQL